MAGIESVSVKAAAAYVRRSETTIRRWLREGRLDGRKVDRGGPGGTWYITRDSLDRVAAEMDAATTATAGAAATDEKVLAELVRLREEISELKAAVRRLLPPATKETVRRPWRPRSIPSWTLRA